MIRRIAGVAAGVAVLAGLAGAAAGVAAAEGVRITGHHENREWTSVDGSIFTVSDGDYGMDGTDDREFSVQDHVVRDQ